MDTSFEIVVLETLPEHTEVPRQQGTVGVYDIVGVADVVDPVTELLMVVSVPSIELVVAAMVR